MSQTELDVFAQFARDYCTVMREGQQLSLSERVFGLYRALCGVHAVGASLPVVPGNPAAPRAVEFPGLGSYEAYWTVGPLSLPGDPVPLRMSDTLAFVFVGLWSGLERYDAGDKEGAAGTWGLGFEQTWGPASAELVHALHPVVAAYRDDLRQEGRRRAPSTPNLVQPQAAEPVETPAPTGLGVAFVPCPGGLEIIDVHRRGAAAGKLQVGDLVIGVNGTPIDELEPEQLDGFPLRFEIFRAGETLYIVVG